MIALSTAALSPKLLEYMTFQRFTLDANHFWVSGIVILAAGVAAFVLRPGVIKRFLSWILLIACASGGLMLAGLWWVAYSVFDLSIVLLAAALLIQTAVLLAHRDKNASRVRQF